MNTSDKAAYVRPALNQVGSFEEITLATGGQSALDASFPASTPFSQLTFS